MGQRGGVGRGVARILALEAVAATPTVAALAFGLRFPGTIVLAALCLAAGYALVRMRGARPVEEGAWLGLAIGGGLGLASALVAQDVAGSCLGVECGTAGMLWLRSWLIAIVACSGIGLAAGFLANYDRHRQDVRLRRLAMAGATPHRFARLK